jgi:flagellar basal-body rod modification protein FlgD
MITTVGGTNSAATNSTRQSGGLPELSNDMFLSMFAKQLQYQDPTSPMDTDQFLAQLAQLTTVEGITNMSTGIEALGAKLDKLLAATSQNADLKSLTALDAGASLLGKIVQFGPAETDIGIVDQIKQANGKYSAVVNGKSIPIESLISVTEF